MAPCPLLSISLRGRGEVVRIDICWGKGCLNGALTVWSWLAFIERNTCGKVVHGADDPRFLVRVQLDLFVPDHHAHRRRGGSGRRRGAATSLPAWADIPGTRLGHLAVQSLSSQGPLHVARPRAH